MFISYRICLSKVERFSGVCLLVSGSRDVFFNFSNKIYWLWTFSMIIMSLRIITYKNINFHSRFWRFEIWTKLCLISTTASVASSNKIYQRLQRLDHPWGVVDCCCWGIQIICSVKASVRSWHSFFIFNQNTLPLRFTRGGELFSSENLVFPNCPFLVHRTLCMINPPWYEGIET